MVDYNELRKKFPTKKAQTKKSKVAIKLIAREYELKRAELGMRAPRMKKGIVFYAVVIIGLLMLASLVLSAAGKGGRARQPRDIINAKKSLDALAIAIGRFRFHTGEYPANIEELASKTVVKAGWNGPYISKVVPDPWGQPYVYIHSEASTILYSKGPDKIAGTTDDLIPEPSLFDEPFRDTTWTNDWMPHHLRGYVLASDEATKKDLQEQVEKIKNPSSQKPENQLIPGSLKIENVLLSAARVIVRLSYETLSGAVTRDEQIEEPIFWTPSNPHLYKFSIGTNTINYAVRNLSVLPSGEIYLNDSQLKIKPVTFRMLLGAKIDFALAHARMLLTCAKKAGANVVVSNGDFVQELCDEIGLINVNDARETKFSAHDLATSMGETTEIFYRARAMFSDEPTVKLWPNYSGVEGENITLKCITNGDSAELYINGESKGRALEWTLPFESGEAKVIAFKNNIPLGEETLRSPFRPAAIELHTRKTTLADNECAFVSARITDDFSTQITDDTSSELTFSVSGPCETIKTNQKGPNRGIIIKRKPNSGEAIKITATSKNLRSAILLLHRE